MTDLLSSPVLTIGESHQPLVYKVILIAFMVIAIGAAVGVSAWRKWRDRR